MKYYAFFVLVLFLFVGCKSDMDSSIKEGYFDSCKSGTVEELVDGYFDKPEWESFVSPDDNKYHLNVSGGITYNNLPAKALLQFEINKDKTWKINAFEIDGEPQNELMIASIVSNMCEEVSGGQKGK